MTRTLDETHSPTLRSWVDSANGHPYFPIQNLPFGIFSPPEGRPRGGVAIGDAILDLGALSLAGLLRDEDTRLLGEACCHPTLNGLLDAGSGARRAMRRGISAVLACGARPRPDLLYDAAACTLHVPAMIGDYTDFYAGIHHATNVGRLFRPDAPLLPNYKFLPIGYGGRASSVRPSGSPVCRPSGQRHEQGTALPPSFGPTRRLDYEVELGIWIGPGNAPGVPIPIGQAADHIAGYCLLNDWSARDLQAWEYQPLGPFLAKSFATSISPWIVTPEALAPFRAAQPPRPAADPRPLPYLWDGADQAGGALAVRLEVELITSGLPPHRLSRATALDLYWTPAQLVAHHTSNGCGLRAGDLLGTGTISSPSPDGLGSLLEITAAGPLTLASGETRRFLEDGDEVVMRGYAEAPGYVSIGFGECRGQVKPANPVH